MNSSSRAQRPGEDTAPRTAVLTRIHLERLVAAIASLQEATLHLQQIVALAHEDISERLSRIEVALGVATDDEEDRRG